MEIEITSTDAKPLLHRTEVRAHITFQNATPSRKEVVAGIAKATKGKKELVIVRSINTHYGNKEATVEAFIYDSQEALDTLEWASAKKKHVFEKKTEEQPTKEKKEEKAEEKAPEKAEEKPADEAAPKAKEEKTPADEKKEEKAPEKAKEKPADEKKGDD